MAFFLRRVRDHAEAEDLTQEVFARLLGGERSVAAPDGYVFQVAANLVTDRARRAKVRSDYRENLTHVDAGTVELIDPYRIVSARAAVEAIEHHLQALPERTRTIFVLYRIENMSQADIADAFGISTSAVKKQVGKAMAFLMQKMRALP